MDWAQSIGPLTQASKVRDAIPRSENPSAIPTRLQMERTLRNCFANLFDLEHETWSIPVSIVSRIILTCCLKVLWIPYVKIHVQTGSSSTTKPRRKSKLLKRSLLRLQISQVVIGLHLFEDHLGRPSLFPAAKGHEYV